MTFSLDAEIKKGKFDLSVAVILKYCAQRSGLCEGWEIAFLSFIWPLLTRLAKAKLMSFGQNYKW
jgi:hypothetical protein